MQSDIYLSEIQERLGQAFLSLDSYQRRVDSWRPIFTEIAKAIGTPIPENSTIGVLPLEEINAVAKKFSDGSYLIGINMGFLFFAESIANIASAYFPQLEEVGWNPLCDEWGKNQFSTMLLQEFGIKTTGESPADPRTQEQKKLGEILSDIASFNIIAHEYSHVMMRHHELVVTSKRQVPISYINDSVDEIPLTHKLEVAADNNGLIITLKYADLVNRNLALAFWANDYVFSCMHFVTKFRNEVILPAMEVVVKSATSPTFFPFGRSGSHNSHPEVLLRREALRYFMRNMPGNNEGDHTVANIALSMSDKSDGFIAKLWDTSKDFFSTVLQTTLQKVK